MSSTVAVRGQAQAECAPDYATISFSVQTRNSARSGALAETNRLADALRESMAELEIRSLQCSRARTGRDSHWDDGGKTRIFDDWVVTLAGTVEADVGQVARVAAALIRVGVSVGYIHWQLDKLNPAFRQVRKDAVSDAKRAAEDFADALGGRLGVLITLADPGLGGMSSLAPGQGGAVARADGFGPLGKAAAGDEFDDELNLDPEQVEICAAVEACYQVELTDRTS